MNKESGYKLKKLLKEKYLLRHPMAGMGNILVGKSHFS